MKKIILSFLFLILFLIGSIYSISSNVNSGSDPNWYLIKVYVYKDGAPVEGALVRVTGTNYDKCGYTSSSGTCAFYPDNAGTYNICASKNNYVDDDSRYVPPNADVTLYLNTSGGCVDCPDSKK
ncbi:MAG: hypothetical protein NTU73_07700 [Ignavibacteriae bacterium]|nr:hypothetical protein [Ignavibacteriota bacterium]